VGFEPTIAVLELAKTVRALDRAATAIGIYNSVEYLFLVRSQLEDGSFPGDKGNENGDEVLFACNGSLDFWCLWHDVSEAFVMHIWGSAFWISRRGMIKVKMKTRLNVSPLTREAGSRN
jgi:hypothetical protein